ncbi:immunoglobulin-like domain-containing protein [Listeria ilorinensis]|uniref:immunoglobulin-like domain-containing protein n=1 Tax=Listeria ilorinensis TaxID=2867439 RepID=UPI001EF72046|nr:immunoglobulin-like domain-containing protein [Listeria ilorinensis]
MKKNVKKILVGLLTFNVLASAPLTAISVNAEEVQSSTSEKSNKLNASAATNLIQNSALSFNPNTNSFANWYYYRADTNQVIPGSAYFRQTNVSSDVMTDPYFFWSNDRSNVAYNGVMKDGNRYVYLSGYYPKFTGTYNSLFYVTQKIPTIPGAKYKFSAKVTAEDNDSYGINSKVSISNNNSFTDIIRSQAVSSPSIGEYKSVEFEFTAKSSETYVGLGNTNSNGALSKIYYGVPSVTRILDAPKMSSVTTKSTSVDVTGEPGAKITVYLPNGSRTFKAADSNGKVTLSIPNQEAGAEIKATQEISGSEESEAASTIVGLEAPTLSSANEQTTSITVKGDPGANITLMLPDGLRIVKTANAQGEATFAVSNLVAGDVIKAIQSLNGQTSGEGFTIVQALPIEAPNLSAMTTDDTTITATGKPGARMTIIMPDGSDVSKVADADGKAAFNIGKQKFGTIIKAVQTLNGETSPETSITVTQGEVAAPTIDEVTTKDTIVKGTGIAGATVTVKADNKTYTGTVGADGNYSIKIPAQVEGTVITVTQEQNGVTSNAVSTTVTKAAQESTLTANDFILGSDSYIKGTYTGDVAKLAIEVNGTLQQKINATGSPYQYYAKGKVTAPTDQVYVISYDADGNQLQKVKVNVFSNTAGQMTPNTYYLGKDNYVTGTLSGDIVKFSLTVNGVEYNKINVTTAPTFKYYANSLIKNTTDVVKVNGYDAYGNLLDSKPVTVTKYQGNAGTITSADTFKLGKDSYVTGTYTGDIAKVELQVNGVAKQRINVSDGTIKYYAKDKITTSTDVVKLVGYNSEGIAISAKNVPVSVASGSVTANPFVIGTDSYVKGTFTGDVAKISLTVNGVKYSTISVPTSGSDYQYYAKTLIKNENDKVVLTAYDAVGGVLDTKTVSVSKKS